MTNSLYCFSFENITIIKDNRC